MSSADRQRYEHEPGFVLHSYAFRETSLIVEIFTRRHGRIGLVARGARRARSALRGALLAFQPLLLSWGGKSELRTLYTAEWQGGIPQLKGLSLICGFYLNELLLKFLARDDPHEALFDVYADAIGALAREIEVSATLRRFEKHLLRELGYALTLDRLAGSDQPIDPRQRYAYIIERGPVPVEEVREPLYELAGKTLLDLACDNYQDPITLIQSKSLMRHLVGHYLGTQTLHTRELLVELQQL
ncbi:MAG: DNA repair protein RecO [Burkholderiales bacterium]